MKIATRARRYKETLRDLLLKNSWQLDAALDRNDYAPTIHRSAPDKIEAALNSTGTALGSTVTAPDKTETALT
ncbi:MAG TPA: hypothetical protein VK186_14725, partial [Candidatus Deferrimicrobium sp.]|nr:hypothetical protein [Candidatus Deferrimicrobium sp.]